MAGLDQVSQKEWMFIQMPDGKKKYIRVDKEFADIVSALPKEERLSDGDVFTVELINEVFEYVNFLKKP